MGKPQLIRLAARFVIVAYDIPAALFKERGYFALGKSQPRKKNIRYGISAALCGALADIVKTGYNFDMPPRIGIL